eukprot:s5343_g2.t1
MDVKSPLAKKITTPGVRHPGQQLRQWIDLSGNHTGSLGVSACVSVRFLPSGTLLCLLLPHFRAHAGRAQGLILMLEEASASAEMGQEEDTDVSQLSRKLESVLSRMSLASLVGLISSRSFENGLSMRVQAELDRLRSAAG